MIETNAVPARREDDSELRSSKQDPLPWLIRKLRAKQDDGQQAERLPIESAKDDVVQNRDDHPKLVD